MKFPLPHLEADIWADIWASPRKAIAAYNILQVLNFEKVYAPTDKHVYPI